ncbi:MAG: helix-turn-helix domain-containing protein [Mycobacterium sp.]
MPDESSEPLAALVGRNLKRIRSDAGVTQDGLARCAREVGLRWTASAVGDFEAGRSAPTFATVLAITLALQMASERAAKMRATHDLIIAQLRGEKTPHQAGPPTHVTLADLVGSERSIALTDELDVPAAAVADVCRGRTWMEAGPEQTIDRPAGTLARHQGLTEHRLARRLGISPDRLAEASFRLWQNTFSEERDRRAGPDANQQKRGRVSRELRAELEKALVNGHH